MKNAKKQKKNLLFNKRMLLRLLVRRFLFIILDMLQQENVEFLRYAEDLIREQYTQGKDITPLILDLKSYKKKSFNGF